MPDPIPYTPFQRTEIDTAQFDSEEAWQRYRDLAKIDPHGRTAEQYREIYATLGNDECYINSRYLVMVRRHPVMGDTGPLEMVHLSIKRRDQGTIHDWRDLQRIKNDIVGPECEGVELYPAESRCVDTANQYHLWVMNDPTFHWPVGWHEGQVKLDADALNIGSVQREFEKGFKDYAGALSKIKDAIRLGHSVDDISDIITDAGL